MIPDLRKLYMMQVSEKYFNAEADMIEVSERYFDAEADSVDGLIVISRGNGLFDFYYPTPKGKRFGRMLGWDHWYLER